MKTFQTIPIIILAVIIGTVMALAEKQEKVDINHANIRQLRELPGIGPALALRIVRERERRGGFRMVDDLLKVKGIGRKLLVRLRPRIKATPYETETLTAVIKIRTNSVKEKYHD